MDEEKGRVGKWGERKGREGRTKGGRREGRTKGGRREEGEGKGGGGGERKRVEGREGTEKERPTYYDMGKTMTGETACRNYST